MKRAGPTPWIALVAIALIFSGYAIILPGTRVCGVDVGWLTPGAAAERLDAALDWPNRKTQLTGNGLTREAYFASDIGIVPNLLETVNDCRRPIWSIFSRDIPLVVTADPAKISSLAADLAAQFNVAASDAALAIGEGDKVIVIPEVVGRTLDFPAFRAIFLDSCCLRTVPETIDIPFTSVEPMIKSADLERFLPLERIASYSTRYTAGNDRAFNIDLACATLQGPVVWPGGTFSFNGTVGPRTQDRGYRKAPTFVGEQTVDDFGGGVCQVSTTLYVALLKAGFGVTERYCHSMPVSYVPLGFDATVTYGYLDLKMTNRGEAPCLVRVTARGGELTAEVFGRLDSSLGIEIESRVLKQFPAAAPPAQEAVPGGDPGTAPGEDPGGIPAPGSTQEPVKKLRDGYLVETVRKFLRDGQVERVEKLDTSMYPAEKPKTKAQQ